MTLRVHIEYLSIPYRTKELLVLKNDLGSERPFIRCEDRFWFNTPMSGIQYQSKRFIGFRVILQFCESLESDDSELDVEEMYLMHFDFQGPREYKSMSWSRLKFQVLVV